HSEGRSRGQETNLWRPPNVAGRAMAMFLQQSHLSKKLGESLIRMKGRKRRLDLEMNHWRPRGGVLWDGCHWSGFVSSCSRFFGWKALALDNEHDRHRRHRMEIRFQGRPSCGSDDGRNGAPDKYLEAPPHRPVCASGELASYGAFPTRNEKSSLEPVKVRTWLAYMAQIAGRIFANQLTFVTPNGPLHHRAGVFG